jgi:hypothetical protein
MEEAGVDLIRGGIYDAMERQPANGMPSEFAWETTKDFWQQEQAILAYYIMSGIPAQYLPTEEQERYLELARYCTMFWNVFFVDQENREIYFRTTESGAPVVQDGYGIQGGHAIAGYHSFELNYLAHLYIRTYVAKSKGQDESFCLSFRPQNCEGIETFNVLPDFFRPEDLKIIGVKFNGVRQSIRDPSRFQIDIRDIKPETEIEVEFMPIRQDAAFGEQLIAKEREGTIEMPFGAVR